MDNFFNGKFFAGGFFGAIIVPVKATICKNPLFYIKKGNVWRLI